MITKVFSVPEVHCDHCVLSIESAVGALEGVESVSVDVSTKDVTVNFDEARLPGPTIVAAIEAQGYDVAPT